MLFHLFALCPVAITVNSPRLSAHSMWDGRTGGRTTKWVWRFLLYPLVGATQKIFSVSSDGLVCWHAVAVVQLCVRSCNTTMERCCSRHCFSLTTCCSSERPSSGCVMRCCCFLFVSTHQGLVKGLFWHWLCLCRFLSLMRVHPGILLLCGTKIEAQVCQQLVACADE